MRLIPRSRTDQVSLAGFVGGALLVMLGAAYYPDARFLVKVGALLWALAYFVVLWDNWRSRVPVRTRGGEVRPEDGRVQYFAAYGFLVAFGALFALVVLVW